MDEWGFKNKTITMIGHQLKPSQCGFEMTGALQSTSITHYANTGTQMW